MVSFFIAALVGVGVGVLSGLLGIGGGTVMVPLFRLAFGMEPIAATATSLFTIVPTSISGMWKHAKNKTSLLRVGIVCGLTGACLSPVGVWAANSCRALPHFIGPFGPFPFSGAARPLSSFLGKNRVSSVSCFVELDTIFP